MGLLVDETMRKRYKFTRKTNTRIRVIESKTIINSNDNLQNFPNKPLGLVFWQGRRWSEATTLPRCAAKCNPLGLVFQNVR